MKVSLIVGSLNRAEILERCIPSWFRFTKPDELILINDGFQDNTDHIFNMWREKESDVNFIYKYTGRNSVGYRGPCFAHNWGAKIASGDVVAFTDPEILFVTDAIGILKEALKENPRRHVGVGTLYRVRRHVNISFMELLDPAQVTKRQEVVEWYPGHESKYNEITKFKNVKGYYFGGCMKKTYIEVGGKDERFIGFGGEDIEFLARLERNLIPHLIHQDIILVHLYHAGADQLAIDLAEDNMRMLHEAERDFTMEANIGKEWGMG